MRRRDSRRLASVSRFVLDSAFTAVLSSVFYPGFKGNRSSACGGQGAEPRQYWAVGGFRSSPIGSNPSRRCVEGIPYSKRYGLVLHCRSHAPHTFRTFATLYPPQEALGFGSSWLFRGSQWSPACTAVWHASLFTEPPTRLLCHWQRSSLVPFGFESLLIKTKDTVWCPLFLWRRRRDSNPRTTFGGYTISNRAPSTELGDSSVTTILIDAFPHPWALWRVMQHSQYTQIALCCQDCNPTVGYRQEHQKGG